MNTIDGLDFTVADLVGLCQETFMTAITRATGITAVLVNEEDFEIALEPFMPASRRENADF